ncbi:S-adenosyl-L-methionine-dependent methyltransferase [Lobosporangium transversale]|uniref:S-adenosyl-L-methionine-dependent methyltransferase n=1 Tax=Lobosporangium transversale TaxID=64571 RepID=A0A1Y2GUG7_9FUNG|nr:S-adenosyl-L-methionine-dependent methyltransferase [Lobosporangium transversale]ORZ23871.1 S-adenosyl-L-methionine-dependent methyltransferase [Lobosporangium transversale]|eukprot:XP_021883685.1 S-adenosyl-L-methionine-dependent methyltransferase [Lobosporangium transversale]
MLYTAHTTYDDIENKAVGDFGCGCGILSIAAAMMGSAYNVGFDIDPDAIAIALRNCEEFEIEMDFILADLSESAVLPSSSGNSTSSHDSFTMMKGKLDTILMNPPFGTREKGIDMVFLKRGIDLANHAVYSLHKTSTREHILKKAKEWGVKCEVVAELRYNLDKSYSFHKKKSQDIAVDFLRFEKCL